MNQPIKTALLSYGMSGEIFHAPLISSLAGFELSLIVQRKTHSARERYPDVRIVKSVEAAIADPEIELVVVNTPNETHFDLANAALMAGKHVVVEKPFTVDPSEGRNLIETARMRNRVLSVFQNRRWDGDFMTVQKIVREGAVGKVVEFEAHYDRFRNYIEPNTWKEEKRPGTGILYNLGSHMLDQVLVLFGMPQYIDARIGIQRPGGFVDDYYDIRMEYPEHLAIVKSSYLVKAELPRYIVHGTEGSFIKLGLDPQEQDLKEKKDPGSHGWGREAEVYWGRLETISGTRTVETIPGNYKAFYENVYHAIRNGGELSVKPGEALDVIRLISLCYESASLRKAMKV
jgi:scyllo-inositol 2-dehydrogenase (NADP+)